MGHNHLEGEWKSGLCSCSGPCFTACFCPCITIGKNAARLNNPSDTDPSCCNGTCLAYIFLEAVGAGCILTCLQRKEVRDKYNIRGDGCNDFCVGCWCRCCALMQHAREIEEREVFLDKRGYQTQPGMQVPVPQYQTQQYQQPVYVMQQNQTQQYPQQQHHHHQQHFELPHVDVQHHQT